MSAIATSATKALMAWKAWRAAIGIDATRNARMAFNAAEKELAHRFAEANLRNSTIEIDDWTVTIEACQQVMEGGSVPSYPLIMYRQHEGRKS